jgi:3-dehydroquinate synthase II
MGDEVMVVNLDGSSRSATVGRVKIERRPFILFRWKDENNNEAGALLQQAETVRLVSSSNQLISITELVKETTLLGWTGGVGRHIGIPISAEVAEK